MRKLYSLSLLFLILSLAGTAWSGYIPNWQLFERSSSEDGMLNAQNLVSSGQAAACTIDNVSISSQAVTKCENNGNGFGYLEVTDLMVDGSSANLAQYDFIWYRADDIYGEELATGKLFKTFEPGSYTVIVQKTDNKGNVLCSANFSRVINDEIPETVIDIITKPDVFKCDEFTNVEVVVKDVGGNNFQVEWWKDGKKYYNNKTTVTLDEPGVWTMIGFNPETKCEFTDFLILDDIVRTPEVAATVTANTNCENGNGSVTFTVNAPEGTSEPANGYTYSLVDEDGNTYSFDSGTLTSEDLLGGVYTLKVGNPAYDSQDNFLGDCGVDFTFTIADALQYPEATLTPTNNTVCAEGNGVLFNGALAATITLGGTAVTDLTGYELIWKKGADFASATEISTATVNKLNNLSGGTYWLSVKSPAGCTIPTPASAVIADTPPVYTLTTTPTPQTNCNTPANGSIATSFTDAAGNLVSGATYQWFQGSSSGTQLSATGAMASNLAGNQSYTVIATDLATNCTATATVTLSLNQLKPTFITSTTPNIGCVDGKYTGSITATLPAGSTGTYTYTFYQGNSTSGTLLQQGTSNTVTGQPADSYTVVVTNDATGCSSDPVAVSVIDDLGALSITYSSTPQTLCNATNGSVTASLDGATGTVTYQWTDASGNSIGSGASLSGLAGGKTYTVTATDEGTGCTRTQSVSVALQQEKPIFSLAPSPNTICDPSASTGGVYTGQVAASLDPSSTAATFSYAWYQVAADGTATLIATQTGATLTGQPAGDYRMVATNTATGCTSDALTTTINDNLPTYSVAFPSVTVQTNCTGTLNGQIVAEMQNASGGAVSGATYEWFEGNTADAANARTDISGATAANLEGSKTYTVRATDPATGCTSLNTYALPLNQEKPVLSLDNVTDNNGCTTGYNGAVTVSVSGYSDPSVTFNYRWYTGGSVNEANRISGASTTSISGLQEGDYTVVAVHPTLGCVSDPITATVAFVKENYTLSLTPTDQTNCKTGTNADGALTAELVGATNVSYTFYEGSGTGGTELTGATQSGTVVTLANLEGPKTYTVVATDNVTGCTYQEEVDLQLIQPTYQLNYTVSPNTICEPYPGIGRTYNGEIIPSIVGQDAADFTFTYNWTDASGNPQSQTGAKLSKLPAGTYKISAKHNDDDCVAAEIEVELTDALTAINLDASSTPNQHCDTNYNGTATVTLADGTDISGNTDYSINWYSGSTATGSSIGTAATLTSQQAGTYTAEVIYTPTGCKNTATAEIVDDLKQVQITTITAVDFSCDPSSTAGLTADVSVGGTAVTDYTGYIFSWVRIDAAGNVLTPISDVTTNINDNQITGLSYAGKYRLTVTDPFGCTATSNYTLASPPAPFDLGREIITYPSDCNAQGSIKVYADIAGTPVTTGYTFEWYSGHPTNPDATFFTDPSLTDAAVLPNGLFATSNADPTKDASIEPDNLSAGKYTVVATDGATGCQAYILLELPFIDAQFANLVSKEDIDECPATTSGKATIEVMLNDNSTDPATETLIPANDIINGDYEVYIFKDITNPVIGTDANFNGSTTPYPVTNNPFTLTDLEKGSYSVIVVEKISLNDCPSTALNFTIEERVVAPTITQGTITPNNVCDGPTNGYNGAVGFTIGPGEYKTGETDPLTKTFNINWLSGPSGFTLPVNSIGVTAGLQPYTDLAPGTYQVQVTGGTSANTCGNTLEFTIPNQPLKPVVKAAITTSLDNCTADAILEITEINFNGSTINSGFTTDYDIFWSGPNGTGSGATYSTSTEGTYTVYVQRKASAGVAGSSCASNTVALNLQDQRVNPIINFAVTHNTSCDVTGTNANGEVVATVTTSGATTPTYAWYAGNTASGSVLDTDNTLSNAAPGTYLLVATDGDNNCDVSKTIIVEDKPIYPTIVSIASDNQTGCGTNIPGSLTVTEVRFNGNTYTASTTPDLITAFDFTWSDASGTVSDGDSDNASLSAAAGTYSVVAKVRGATGFSCPSPAKTGTITQKAAYPTISLVSNSPNVKCDESIGTGPTGQLVVSATTNGTDNGYDYEWTNSSGDNLGTTATLSNLTAGIYTVKVTDQVTGCFSTRSFTVANNLTTPAAPVLKVTGALETCGVAGEITVDVVSPGATDDYTFTWYNEDGDVVQGPDNTSPTFSTNEGGQYAVVAKYKDTGCSSAAGYINLPDKRTYPTATYTVTPNTSCIGWNGKIEVTSITPGTSSSTVSFHWNDLSSGDANYSALTRSNLEPGKTYTFTLTEKGCSKEIAVTVEDKREYFPIILNIEATKQTECDPNGTLEVTKIEIDGVVYDTSEGDNLNTFFDFNWYDADGNSLENDLSTKAGQSADKHESIVTNLLSGEYSVEAVRIQDGTDIPVGNGCPSAKVYKAVGREGDFPEISFSITANQNCSGPGTGTITANITGGITPYTLSWDGRTETVASLADLSGGDYKLTVTDAAGCSTTQTVTVPDEPLYPQVTRLQMSDNTYCNSYNGTLTVAEVTFNGNTYSGSNLNSLFNFQWYDANEVAITNETGLSLTNRPAGDYYVAASKLGAPGALCSSSLFPGSLRDVKANPVVEIVATPNRSCGSYNGELTANVSGGSGNYSYAWYGPGHAGTNQITISNLPAGIYEVLVTDNTSGCEILLPYTLNEELAYPAIADISINPIDQCGGQGSIQINSMSEGTFSDFTFSWTKDGTAYAGNVSSITGDVGTYQITIKANNPALIGYDCEATYEYRITNETPELDVFLYDWRMINGCSETGMLEIRADEYADATDPNYTFIWEDVNGNVLNPDGSNRIDNLPLGEYTYTVFNSSTNCSVSGTFSVTEVIVTPFLIASAEGQWMCSPEDGRLAVRVDNYAELKAAIGPVSFQFDWFRGEHTTNPGQDSPDYVTSGVSIADPNVDVASMLLNDQPNGVYTVFARQIGGNACQALPDMATVLDLRTYPVPQIDLSQGLRNCDPAKPNGMLAGSVGGLTEGYAFEWYEGTDLSLNPVATGPEFNEAKAMRYTLLARDLITQCSDTVSMLVPEDYFVVEADPFWVDQEPSLSCLQPNGRLFLTEDSLADDYIFRWYAGSEVIADSLLATEVNSLDGLKAGIYTITAQSREHGCISDGMQVIVEADYYFPAVDLRITPATCTEAGYVEIIDLDGQVKDYYWSDGTNIFYGETFTGDAGEYFVTIISLEGCSTTLPFEIDEVIKPYNAISANGDGQNDYFHINCIDMFPQNLVKIYNRAGVLVFEIEGYNNDVRAFTGKGNRGIYLNGQNLPDGTYFYVIDRKNGSRPEHGFLELIR